MDMKKLAGDKAATYVKDGMVVGLGTGSTAYHMVNAVGEMVKNGLKIQAIPTSKATEAQARELGIPQQEVLMDQDGTYLITGETKQGRGGVQHV